MLEPAEAYVQAARCNYSLTNDRPLHEGGAGGTVLFTGATSSIRGASSFATFAAGKHGLRALSQSLAREFGKRDIHVAHVIIDGTILTKTTKRLFGGKNHVVQTPGNADAAEEGDDWMDDESRRLDPDSVAKVSA